MLPDERAKDSALGTHLKAVTFVIQLMHTVLVTGANRGLGLEFVRQYAADGWQVLACCRAPGRAEELRTLAASCGRVRIFALDVAHSETFESLASELHGQPLDILLNNAGLRGLAGEKFGATRTDEWLEVLKVNTIAPLRLAEVLLENVAHSERRLIAVITSRMGSIALNTQGGEYFYRSSKAAANAVVKSMANDLHARGITAVTVHPGWARTSMGAPQAPLSAEESVAAIRQLFAGITLLDSGKFFNYDGTQLAW